MSDLNPVTESISVHQMVLDLRNHSALIYWADLLISALVFWVCVFFAGLGRMHWLLNTLLMTVGSLALYRAALFVHEIGHFSRNTLPGFEVAWNVLIGWPLLFPSFLIQSHPDHHRVASFGTVNDPEYLPFASATRMMKGWFLVSSLVTPLILLLRAALIVPVSWFYRPLRQWLRIHASRMTMNNAYKPAARDLMLSPWHEASEVLTVCFAWAWLLTTWFSWLPSMFWQGALISMALANLLNAWRTLHAHAYISTGQPTDQLGQLRDSTTFKCSVWLGELIAPAGQRFHAAHHLFPYLPYHALPEADRRVKASDWVGKADYLKTLR